MLKQIAFSEYDKVKPCIEVVNVLLQIADEFQRQRLEWMLGFAFMRWTQKQDFSVRLGLELSCSHDLGEEVYMMKSMLTYDPENDSSLIHLLWRYHGRMDTYTVNCLEDLSKVMA